MKVHSANANWFTEDGTRLDASFHLSEGRGTKMKILKSPYPISTIGAVTNRIYYGNRSKRIYVEPQYGVPFLGSSDMLQADFSNTKHISKRKTPDLPSYFVEKGWTLVSRSGTIGNTIYTNDDFIGKAFSEHIIRVVPNFDLIKSGYLFAFLASKYGYALLTQGTFGAVIQHIESHHIAGIPIPLLPESQQRYIHELVEEAARLRVEANASLKLFTGFFENKFPSYQKEYNLAFEISNKRLGFSWAGRNNEKYAQMLKDEVSNQENFVLSEVATAIFAPPMFKHIYLKRDNGNVFYTGTELSNSFRRKERFLSNRGVNRIEDYKVANNCTLVYKSGPRDGMLGQVFTAYDSLVDSCLSDHVIRVVIDDQEINDWAFAFLKSNVGLKILQSIATGSAILFITPNRLGDLKIPSGSEPELNLVSSWVQEYRIKFAKAHMLEETAISSVESTIFSW